MASTLTMTLSSLVLGLTPTEGGWVILLLSAALSLDCGYGVFALLEQAKDEDKNPRDRWERLATSRTLVYLTIISGTFAGVAALIFLTSGDPPGAVFLGVVGALLAWRGSTGRVKSWYVNQTLRLLCEQCNRYIGSDVEWRCGYCEHVNKNTSRHPHFSRCGRCGTAPPAFACMHCGHPNPLGSDRNTNGYPARSAHHKTPEPVNEPDPEHEAHEEKMRELMRDKELNEAMQQVAESREQRMKAEARVNPPSGKDKDNGKKPQSEYEKARARVVKMAHEKIGSKMALAELREALRKEYGTNEDMRDAIDDVCEEIAHQEALR